MGELNKKEKMLEYHERITDEVECGKSEKGDVEEEWQLFKSAVVGCTEV